MAGCRVLRKQRVVSAVALSQSKGRDKGRIALDSGSRARKLKWRKLLCNTTKLEILVTRLVIASRERRYEATTGLVMRT